ncbi:Cysteine-rich outer membrane protein [Anaerohalosphaera lusitana]|uniref:Cysteine-rich outer membrane protein n=1 Tax=Anaerohalosphaera lusitana TaxID=1936003 RepID=A0A1U9NJT9_9BACT|nr:DUF11 domain-containing protein [Anaerohalosphaera lusitana]AQT67776.1 Cysteine-rich outer membrane protein [Anaerohalosphaera lusitana]
MKIKHVLTITLLIAAVSLTACCPREKTARVEEPMREPDPCAASAMAKAETVFPRDIRNVVQLEKMAPEQIVAGQPFEYRLKVTNLTSETISNVRVSDTIPQNLTVTQSEPEMASMEERTAHWMIGELEGNGTRMITVTARASGTGMVRSCASVTYDSPLCAQMNIVQPKLRITKIAPTEALSCDRIPVKYVVTNNGTGYACDLQITDPLPEGLVDAEGNDQVSFNIDSIGPNESKEFSIMLDATTTGTFSSKATVASANSGTSESNMTRTEVTEPKLQITASAPQRQFMGKSITYQVTVKNTGSGPARDTTVVANVPDGIDFETATDQGEFTTSSPGKVTWNVGTIPPNEQKTVTMKIRYNREGELVSRVTAVAHCAEEVEQTASTSVTGIPALLTEVVDTNDPVEIGENTTYRITITNQGSTAGKNIQITCALPESMQYVSSTGPTTASAEGNTITFKPLMSLAAGQQQTWTVNIKALQEDDSRFEVKVTSDTLTKPVRETESTMLYQVR